MSILLILIRLIVAFAGGWIVYQAVFSVIRTFVLPRSASDSINTAVFRTLRFLFSLRVRSARSYEERDSLMALFAPIGLLLLLPTWLTMVLVGYGFVYWTMGINDPLAAFRLSGSSLLTLGFEQTNGVLLTILTFTESAVGLILVALLIAYLPTMYTAFSEREAAVNMLEVRAGAPPSAITMIIRLYRIGRIDHLSELWEQWERWFVYVEETHTSLAALAFFRSPQPSRSWVTAAGAVLDAAALVNAAVDIPHDSRADLCIRAGYLALREIARFFHLPFDPLPKVHDPSTPFHISISRYEFDKACEELAAASIPLKPDREQAWHDFAGWRITYDKPLLGLAALTMAPYAPWSSDRSLVHRSTPKK